LQFLDIYYLSLLGIPIVSPIPPRTRTHDITNFKVINSCIKIIPPAAAINGTLSCDTAALVDGILGKT
jgi:hypothetical protein